MKFRLSQNEISFQELPNKIPFLILEAKRKHIPANGVHMFTYMHNSKERRGYKKKRKKQAENVKEQTKIKSQPSKIVKRYFAKQREKR